MLSEQAKPRVPGRRINSAHLSIAHNGKEDKLFFALFWEW
jgi:hypothetical protein